MKQAIILLCCAMLGGCIEHAQSASEQSKEQQVFKLYDNSPIKVWHDDQRRVTCWSYGYDNRGGLSCIPDSQLAGGK